jgi:8-oxo-dGTP pyrophosphatase MutT (NUDIX family)
LVKLRYASGWRLAGGGRHAGESAEDAVLRELREEIGMVAHGRVRLACELEQVADFRKDLASVLVVEDVRYRPHWSWEIERVIEVPPDALPPGMSPLAAEWIAAVSEAL